MTKTELELLYKSNKESKLFGRYITLQSIHPLLKKLPSKFKVNPIGKSVKGESIFSVTFGNGPKRILMWSQMHGNESTTTKAIFDMFNCFFNTDKQLNYILNSCTICVVPILNPDGANVYTRINANKVDLNRDAQDLSQPESKVLLELFNTFKPDFCYNLHGQRTIFSAGKVNRSATVSFLSPAEDQVRTVTKTRKIAMELIVEMTNLLQHWIPQQIGRYDDGFNINCVGDTFQNKGVPTVLFEAGHYHDDYEREKTREFIFYALMYSLQCVSDFNLVGDNYKPYFNIPENDKLFNDIIIRNGKVKGDIVDIAIQFKEKLIGRQLEFIPKVEKISKNIKNFAHNTINANGNRVLDGEKNELSEENEIDFVLVNNEKLPLKL